MTFTAKPSAAPTAAELVEHGQRRPSLKWARVSLALIMLLSSLAGSIATIGLPALARAFDASFQDVQWVILAYLLAITSLIVSVGRLGDMLGRRRLLLAGLLVFTVASALCGVAPSLGLLIAARAAQGLGAAVMLALSMALISETVSREQTGSAMGLLGSMSAVGTALGPSLGGALIAGSGWPAIFLLNLPLGLLALILAARHLPADRPIARGEPVRFDHLGTLVLALTLAAYALAMTLGHGSVGLLNAALLVAAVAGAGLFVRVETTAAAPLIRLAMFRDSTLGASFAMSTLVMTVMMATLVVGPFYLAVALGLDAARVGLAMSCGPIVSALMGVPAGRIVDRFGAQRMTLTGLGGMAAGAAGVLLLPMTLGVLGYVAPLCVITAGYALFQAANNTAVMADVHPERRGLVAGLLNLARNLGLITGASLMGSLFALGAATSDLAGAPPAAIVAGMRTTFAVAALLIGSAFAIALASAASAGRQQADRRLD